MTLLVAGAGSSSGNGAAAIAAARLEASSAATRPCRSEVIGQPPRSWRRQERNLGRRMHVVVVVDAIAPGVGRAAHQERAEARVHVPVGRAPATVGVGLAE